MKKLFEKIKLALKWIVANFAKPVALVAVIGLPIFIFNKPTQFSIIFTGDTGTGDADQTIVAGLMKKEGIEEVRILGDVIYESGLDSANDKQFDKKFYSQYKDFKKIGIALGNHDHLGDVYAWIDLAKKYSNVFFPNFYYAEKLNDLCLMTIDTEKIDQSLSSDFTVKQTEWVRNTLQGFYATDCKLIIAMGHHPRYSVGEHGDDKYNFKKFFDAELAGKVDVYLSGHDHNLSYEGEIGKTHHFTTGAGGQLRDLAKKPRVWAASKLGYIIFEYKGNGVANFAFRVLDNGEARNIFEIEIKGAQRAVVANKPEAPKEETKPLEEKINGVSWSIQYKGNFIPKVKDYHVVDLFDVKDEDLVKLKNTGAKPVCYFSSQYEEWRPDAKLFDGDDLGKKLDSWKGERWVKTKSKNVREIMEARVRLASTRGCYAIDVDNVDFYSYKSKTGFNESKEDAVEYVKFFANLAHQLGMKFSLKNALEIIPHTKDVVDFYQNESCHKYKECDVYKDVNKPVFNIEYEKCYLSDYPNMYTIWKSDGMNGHEIICD